MEADFHAAEGGERRPLLLPLQSHTSRKYEEEALSGVYQGTQLQDKPLDWRAPAIILGFECLESMAFNGISTNLVVYMHTILHGNTASSAANVSIWYGTSYFVPIVGATIADTYLGNYKTVLTSLIMYLLGMLLITLSALVPFDNHALSAREAQNLVFFGGLYLVAFGSGGVRSALLPFGADQFNDENNIEREKKKLFFSWFYLCVIFGVISSGTFIVWIQENIGWALGFSIATLCIALAFGGFVAGTLAYRVRVPSGSPLRSICQVLAASFRKISLQVPTDSSFLYEADCKSSVNLGQHKLAHTDDFRFLDRAAVISASDLKENGQPQSPWRICTVTQVEQLKILLRLLPIWITSVIQSAAFSQMHTTFIQQGRIMNTRIWSFSIPPASLYSFEVVCTMTWVLLYHKLLAPTIRSHFSSWTELSHLQRIGIGRFLMILAMASAALVEVKRLHSIRIGKLITIAWQLPQYFIVAGSEFFSLITQLEFFHDQAPDSMKSILTAFALLTIALGNYFSSFIITIIAAATSTHGRPGWIPQDLNEGHLDYYFWLYSVLSALNFAVYVLFARKYKAKEAILATGL